MLACNAEDTARLIELSKDGDGVAFGTLLARSAGRIHLWLRRSGRAEFGPDFGVDDAWQETIGRIWEHLAEFVPLRSGSFHVWALGFARNVLRDRRHYIEAGKRRAGVRADAPDAGIPPDPVDPATGVSTKAAGREWARRIETALATLSAELREIFWMSVIEERSIQDIASTMGLSKEPVWRRLKQAIREVRARLDMPVAG